ncbi:HAD family hydrolase [Muriicola marianensis]|uniref:Haloacid dehalogenase n=1 Tax=Muriicola marianensis TaxID=1324801 RepID=A0ABQ1QQ66_9FLAO|nr:HAD family phosphatase [Muriicola marianensis]GGD37163.1 haloacid dehalogenase [Muriicola marianensis]
MIKNLLFDFGDVFINLDKEATLRKLGEAGYTEISAELYPLIFQYEKGLIATDEFTTRAMNYFPGLEKEELVKAWNAIILDFPEYRLDFIRDLASRDNYRLFLLSNTNSLHIEKVKEKMGEERYSVFASCFERFYLSHEIGMRKPEPEVFKMIKEQNALVTSETLFIDDTLEHIESAARLGFRTWHLKVGTEEVIDLFKKVSG